MAKTIKNTPKPPASRGFFIFILLVLILLGFFNLFSGNNDVSITYSEFKQKIVFGEIKQVKITSSSLLGSTITSEDQKALDTGRLQSILKPTNVGSFVVYKTVPVRDDQLLPLLDQYGVNYHGELPRNYDFVLTFILFASLIFFMFILPRILGKKMGGANPMSFGQSKGRIVAETELLTKFADVAGCDESKYELAEIVDFLKNPKHYTDIGGKIPRGALLIGPPGTGKTLLARAVAGEAGVTFFKMSGADFVEMFVGVGAARVRDLFSQARLKAPSIIFIDEIDAIGKSRANSLNNNDEREQTLNQLLVEMDGFEASSGVIVLAATNRPEILDSALLRTGRFDRQIMVDRPDINGREEILKIHSTNVKLDHTVNLHEVAVATPGLVGSDLANIVNEAALLAVRGKRQLVTQEDFSEAIEKSAIGLAKRTRVMSRFERENTAYHEVGHALVNIFTAGSDPLRKVSIVPRGFALGVTWSSPVEGRYSKTEEELISYIDVTLGGRGAEQIIYGRITTGASNDIQQATETARSMIMDYGMSQRFMNVAFRSHSNSFSNGRNSQEYSESTQQYIDNEISRIISSRYAHVLALLTKHKELLIEITAIILQNESLSRDEFLDIVKNNNLGDKELEEVASRSLNASQLELSSFEKNLCD